MHATHENPENPGVPRHMRERGGPRATAPSPLRQWHVGVALWLLGALALAVMAFFAHMEPLFPGDAGLVALARDANHTALAPALNFPSEANNVPTGGVIYLGAILVFAVLKRIRAAICVAFTTGIGGALNAIISAVVGRPRPAGAHVSTVGQIDTHSFPSGHVVSVVGLFGFLLFLTILIWRARPALRPWLLPLQAVCVYFLALIGFGRVAEGAHQPSDVLAGYLLGALLLALAIRLYHWLGRRWAAHQAQKAGARAA
ncbi:MAG TPA: phosphatase PAP2 family protein [Ktedonobacterales bacterium]|jgi:membrane-associated phospholipid phosphatase|nr:phosphatase PAP2 family protein [Ktedonobacterales bacterium]